MNHFLKHAGLSSILVLFLAACVEETATPEPQSTTDQSDSQQQDAQISNITEDDKVAVASSRSIDWAAAREALGGAGEAGNVQVQSGPPAPVPVLLPTGIVLPQNATPSYRTLEDGYFAYYPGDRFNIVVNGTMEAYETDGIEGDDRNEMVFSETESGASMALSRFGADYLIEFECLEYSPKGGCITEEEAREIIDKLIVVGTQ